MKSAILAFVAGVFLLQLQAALWTWPGVVLAVLGAVACLGWVQSIRRKNLPFMSKSLMAILRLSAYGVLGFCWANLMAMRALQTELPAQWELRDVDVVGVVDSLPFRSEQGHSFQFAVEKYVPIEPGVDEKTMRDFPHRLALSWFNSSAESAQMGEVKPGQRWSLRVRLKRAHGNANRDGFDYELYWLEQGVRATGTVRKETRLIDDFAWSISAMIERSRFVLRDRIERALPDAPYVGVLTALVVGDQRAISQEDWKIFNRTGIGHLISISGLHITMIAGLFAGLIHYLWRHAFFTRLPFCLWLPAPKAAVLAGALGALLYVALAGFGIPAQRTLWMLSVVAVAMWTGRVSDAVRVLCLALGLVVVLDPWAVLSPGFYLSFAAVAVLMYVGYELAPTLQIKGDGSAPLTAWRRVWERWKAPLLVAARAQYAVTVGLVPLSFLLFSQLSLVSPIANAIAIPLISFVVTPLALLGSVLPLSLAQWVLVLAHACLTGLAHLLTWLSTSALAIWSAPQPTWWMFALAVLGCAYLLAPRGFPMRWLGALCCLPVLLNTTPTPVFGRMTVTAFDVGQGSSVLIETAHHRLLYDTGPGISLDANSGTRILLPYFQARGIQELDMLMISHADSDHSGGAQSVLGQMRVKALSSSLPADHPLVMSAAQTQRCVAGQHWEWDGVRFEVLHPVPEIYLSTKWKTNALSCTLKVSAGAHTLLLAGDIEATQEDELVNSIAPQLAATVLLAPHHGSGTSSTTPFLQAVQPQMAIFQVGYLNRFHHPKTEVLQRYLDFGIKPLRTDTSGAITLQFGDVVAVSHYREMHPRYWYPH
ncbi:MAG: DNA internalization-related competence protein ComEC/Rec2 [Burkholderiales bacterium]|nr:DNA internalization-related competence protein ComEC/Rec2 [Burkholderiales bacterium]